MVIDYKILEDSNREKLEKKVKEYLDAGQRMSGGIAATDFRASESRRYYQAMIKES